MEYKDRKEALDFLCGEIPNRIEPIQALKTVAIILQQYEVAAKLRDMEIKLINEQEKPKA